MKASAAFDATHSWAEHNTTTLQLPDELWKAAVRSRDPAVPITSFTDLERAQLGIPEGLIRYSTGIEHPDDLISCLSYALEQIDETLPTGVHHPGLLQGRQLVRCVFQRLLGTLDAMGEDGLDVPRTL